MKNPPLISLPIFRHFFVFILAALFFPQSGGAVGPESSDGMNEFLARLEIKASEISSFRCRFRQEKHLAVFSRPVIFEGMLYVSRPDRLRWEFTSPLPSVLIFNGQQGVRCSGNSAPVSFDLAGDPVMRSVAQQLWGWLDGRYVALRDQYRMELLKADVLRLEPIDPGITRFVQGIEVTFNPETLQPIRTEIIEPGGDRTILFFIDYVFDPPMPVSLFSSCSSEES